MHPNPDLLVHLCASEEWDAARSVGELRPPSLAEMGFVHLSTLEQVHLPANRVFAGRNDLVLLRLDAGLLGSPVLWEPGAPSDPPSMVFPHLYGPLPVAAVIVAVPYPTAPDGAFPAYRGGSAERQTE